jgi:rhomboid family GlyGly-CTERM serine protease
MRAKETILLAVLIAAANVSLAAGVFPASLIYLPEKVMAGQWWRLATHPFVHVSAYHLLLDGAAFLMLYAQLAERSLAKRIGYLLGIHAAVVAGVTWSLPTVEAVGYCGLSGLAHGLMAVWCLERMGSGGADRVQRRLAMGVLAGLLVKCVYEVTAGHVLFESTHLGYVGVPVVASHLAGVAGAMLVHAGFKVQSFIGGRLRIDVTSLQKRKECHT